MDDFYTRLDDDSKKHEIILKMKLSAEVFTQSYEKLLQQKAKDLNLKGFRKGKTPKDMVEGQLRDLVLAETFEQIAPYYVGSALIKEKLQPVAPPEYIDLGQLKAGENVEFSVKVTVMPQFELADSKKIKVEHPDPDVKESEVDQTIETMFKNNARTKDPKSEGKPDDDWAKRIAKLYQFDDISSLKDLRARIRDLIMQQKKSVVDQNAATDAMREAVKISKIEIPNKAIVFEAQQREEAFQKDLEAAKMSMEDFLQQREIKQEDLKEMWLKDAQEALENDVVLRLYAEKMNVTVNDDELKKEVESMKKSAQTQYHHDHEGHDHPMNFDESAYKDPHWQEQIRAYMRKQKSYRMFLTEVLGAEFFKGVEEHADHEGHSSGEQEKAKSKETKKGNKPSSKMKRSALKK